MMTFFRYTRVRGDFGPGIGTLACSLSLISPSAASAAVSGVAASPSSCGRDGGKSRAFVAVASVRIGIPVSLVCFRGDRLFFNERAQPVDLCFNTLVVGERDCVDVCA